MKPKVGKTDSQEHIFYNMLSKVKLVSKTQLANGQIKEEESNHLKNVIWERIFFFLMATERTLKSLTTVFKWLKYDQNFSKN